MPTNAVLIRIDRENVVQALQEALEKVAGAEGEVALDFSSVQRVDSKALGALEQLACAAESKGVKPELQGVNVEVYKVLKLLKLAPRFSFGN